jgi:hypothetical protein
MVVNIYIFKIGGWKDDIVSMALCECGDDLCTHLSSSVDWAMHDMTEFKKEIYLAHLKEKHAPEEFYALAWLDEPEKDYSCKKAMEINKASK